MKKNLLKPIFIVVFGVTLMSFTSDVIENKHIQLLELQKDCDIKTTFRPDGNVINYFNPTPVIRNSSYDLALSVYKNSTTGDYTISTAVLFKTLPYGSLTGDLIIKTTSNRALKLRNFMSNKSNVNGQTLVLGIYLMTNEDYNTLISSSLKEVFVKINNSNVGGGVKSNQRVLINQFKCLENW